jgi:hypothetical protein
MELTERVKYKQLLFNQFEKRFNDEYLQERARHFKKLHEETPIKVGEVVLIEEPNQKRRDWKSGVIERLIPSADGVVRSVELRTLNGPLHRPVQRLYAYELNENHPLEDDPSNNDDGVEPTSDSIDGPEAIDRRNADTAADGTEGGLPNRNSAQQPVQLDAGAPPVTTGTSADNSLEPGLNDVKPDDALPLSRTEPVAQPQRGSVETRELGRGLRTKRPKQSDDFVYGDGRAEPKRKNKKKNQ